MYIIFGLAIVFSLAVIIYSLCDFGGNKYYKGGHAAGKVHHRRSWDADPEFYYVHHSKTNYAFGDGGAD